MKYQIINYSSDIQIGSDIIESCLALSNEKKISIFAWWSDDLKPIYEIIFDLKRASKSDVKGIKYFDKKKMIKLYPKINLINMFEYLSSDKEEFNFFSTSRNFESIIDPQINFTTFDADEDGKIDLELLATPHSFDETIKLQSDNSYDIAIFKLDRENLIPCMECFVDGIGTNITSINYDDWTNEGDVLFEQTINVGVKFLAKCKKIFIIVNEEEVNDIFVNEKNTVISRMLKSHNNVTYMIKRK